MKQSLSAAIHAVLPRVMWNAIQRFRGLPEVNPWRAFGQMKTCANAQPMFEGKFAELYERYRTLDPSEVSDRWRYRIYTLCYFAALSRAIPGDIVCAGVSWGIAPRIVFDFLDCMNLGKTFHLVDPFEGIVSNDSARVSSQFNCDPDYVMRQYPANAPVVLHRKRIPLHLPGPLSLVFTDTGNPKADAEALPIFYEELSSGGIFITEQYANHWNLYEPVLTRLGVTPLWMPSGQGIIIKP